MLLKFIQVYSNLRKSEDIIIREHKDCKVLSKDKFQQRASIFWVYFAFPPNHTGSALLSTVPPFIPSLIPCSLLTSIRANMKEKWPFPANIGFVLTISDLSSRMKRIIVWIFLQFFSQITESLIIRTGLIKEVVSE